MPRGVSRYDEARLQGRLWTPALLRGKLAAWWDISEGPVDGASGLVAQLNDRSGNANHLTQATSADRPYYEPNKWPSVVRRRTQMRWEASSGTNSMAMTNSIAYDGTAGFSFHAAITHPEYSRTSNLLTGLAGSLEFRFDGAGAVQINRAFQAALYTYTPPSGVSDTVHAPLIVGGDFSSSVVRVHFEGYSGETATNPAITAPVTTVGRHPVDGSGVWSSEMGEIVVFTTMLTPRETQLVVGYLAWKWGTVATLKADHPFKNRPPLIGD